MNPTLWICCYLPLIVVLLYGLYLRRLALLRRIRRKKGATHMTDEILSEFIGQECIIYLYSGQVSGVVQSVQDGWLRIRIGDDLDLVNLEYVSRIRKYPRKKNGKKKSVVLD